MEKAVRQLIQSFFDSSSTPHSDACWCPSVDVYRGRDGWLVKIDLAGVRPEDVEIFTEGRQLTVRGHRRDSAILSDQQAYSMEISYNRFQRSVELPCDLSTAQLSNEYRDGMFLILIKPRSEST